MEPQSPAAKPPPLAQRRCHHHAAREAVARCPACERFFCRECVAPYDHRLLCAACLASAARETSTPTAKGEGIFRSAMYAIAALLLAWGVFGVLGSVLAALPTSFQASQMVEGWMDEFAELEEFEE